MKDNCVSISSAITDLHNALNNLKPTLFNASDSIAHNLATSLQPITKNIANALVDPVKLFAHLYSDI